MERDEVMLKARAIRAIIQSVHNVEQQKEIELRGFMSLFYPDANKKRVDEVVQSAKDKLVGRER